MSNSKMMVPCAYCGELFSGQHGLRRHQSGKSGCSIAPGDAEPELTCSACGYKTNQANDLEYHTRMLCGHTRLESLGIFNVPTSGPVPPAMKFLQRYGHPKSSSSLRPTDAASEFEVVFAEAMIDAGVPIKKSERILAKLKGTRLLNSPLESVASYATILNRVQEPGFYVPEEKALSKV